MKTIIKNELYLLFVAIKIKNSLDPARFQRRFKTPIYLSLVVNICLFFYVFTLNVFLVGSKRSHL